MVIEPITEYLSVKEFAAACHCTTQNIYKQIDGKLAPYIKKDGNRTLISADAITLFTGDPEPDNIEVANDTMEKLLNTYQQLIDTLQVENARLVSQLAVKDSQISAIDERLHESHAITMKLTDRQQALLQAAIDEAEHPVTVEPIKIETRKFKWFWQK